MALIKLGLRDMSLTEKIQFARQIAETMKDNPNFPSPAPPLEYITAAANKLEGAFNDARAARQTAQAKTGKQNERSEELDLLLTQLANHVESVSNGDLAKIQSAGLSPRATAAPIGELPPPGDLAATEGDHECEIDLSWDRVRGARSYVIQMSQSMGEAPAWSQIGASAKSSFTATGLISGKKYWFRVAAIGAAGQGGWSDPATKIAP